jgi:uncharacterized membrane protein
MHEIPRMPGSHGVFEHPLWFLGGVGIGSILMYIVDPEHGHRRRARLRDKVVHERHVVERGVERGVRDLRGRLVGLGARLSANPDREASDQILVQRVRSELGRVVQNAHAIEVRAQDGVIVLIGTCAQREHAVLRRVLRRTPGVRGVDDRLAIQDVAEPLRTQESSLGTRFAAGTIGSVLALQAVQRGDRGRAVALALGTGLVTLIPARRIKRRLFRRAVQRALGIQKTIHVNAPIDRVFALWADLEGLPTILDHVLEVKNLGESRSRWVVRGPFGIPVRWTGLLTENVPNKLLRWTTVDGTLRHQGSIRFDQEPDGSTRIHMQISFDPTPGRFDRALIRLFRAEAKRALDADFVRLKSLLERGKARAHGVMITLEPNAMLTTVGQR